MPLFGLGVLILWLGWFGFNPGSGLNALDGRFPEIAMVTNLAAAAGVIAAVGMMYFKTKRIDIGMAGNGAIAALVAITAPSGYVELWAAPIIGARRRRDRRVGVLAIDKKIDDPVGALSAHGLAGIWGTLACGLFTAPRLAEKNAVGEGGLVLHRLVRAAVGPVVGVVAAFAFVFTSSFATFCADQEDLRPARQRRGRGRRTGHFRARHVRVSGAVHPGSGAGRVCAGGHAGHARHAPAATTREVPA